MCNLTVAHLRTHSGSGLSDDLPSAALPYNQKWTRTRSGVMMSGVRQQRMTMGTETETDTGAGSDSDSDGAANGYDRWSYDARRR